MRTKIIITVLISLFLFSCNKTKKEIKIIDKSLLLNFKIASILENEPYGLDSEQIFDLYLPKNRSSLKRKL